MQLQVSAMQTQAEEQGHVAARAQAAEMQAQVAQMQVHAAQMQVMCVFCVRVCGRMHARGSTPGTETRGLDAGRPCALPCAGACGADANPRY